MDKKIKRIQKITKQFAKAIDKGFNGFTDLQKSMMMVHAIDALPHVRFQVQKSIEAIQRTDEILYLLNLKPTTENRERIFKLFTTANEPIYKANAIYKYLSANPVTIEQLEEKWK